jgi:hypothetical protein
MCEHVLHLLLMNMFLISLICLNMCQSLVRIEFCMDGTFHSIFQSTLA